MTEFKKVIEYEKDGKRYRKVTGDEAKQYANWVGGSYEISAGNYALGWFVLVTDKPKPTTTKPTA